MGDSLLAKYLFENLRDKYPDARYVLITGSRSKMIRDLLEAYPWIEVKEINRKKPVEVVRSIIDLRGSDLVVIPTSYGVFSRPSKFFGRLIASKGALWGYDDDSFLTRVLYSRVFKRDHDRPVMENELEMVRALKINPSVNKPTFSVCNPNEKEVIDLNLKPYKYIVVNLFSGSPKRGLTLKNKQRLINLVVGNIKSYRLVLIGGIHDRGELSKLLIPHDTEVLTKPVPEMLQIIYFAKAVVSVDTGVAHISSGLGKQLLVLALYAGRGWWTDAQHPESTEVLIGEKGPNETGDKREFYPDSLNNFSDTDVKRWLSNLNL